MLHKSSIAIILSALLTASPATAADYIIDKTGQHAFVNFKINHLGFSFIYGTFRDFDGRFSFDPEKPEDSQIDITLQTASVDTNHAERDKHIRSAEMLNVQQFPAATFQSTAIRPKGAGKAEVLGNLTLNGVTRPIVIDARLVGQGDDPWGNYRAGFSGTTTLTLKDFNISADLGPASHSVELIMSFEGIRQ